MSSVVAVHRSGEHGFSKAPQPSITLVAGLGVEGDAHAGVTVKHRSRVAKDPTQPNLRQVHFLHAELLAHLEVDPGALGENITTHGLALLELSAGTLLHLGRDAVVQVTGLRNPCHQINTYRAGLLRRVVGIDPDGQLVRKAGVMGIVQVGGVVRPGDRIRVSAPAVHVAMEKV